MKSQTIVACRRPTVTIEPTETKQAAPDLIERGLQSVLWIATLGGLAVMMLVVSGVLAIRS